MSEQHHLCLLDNNPGLLRIRHFFSGALFPINIFTENIYIYVCYWKNKHERPNFSLNVQFLKNIIA